MKSILGPLVLALAFVAVTSAQITVPLPDRNLVKLLPDYARPKVYGLNRGNDGAQGTLLALNSSNAAVLAEISLGLNPTDMALSPAGESLYVINAGGRTLVKLDLASFAVAASRSFSTPNTYDPDNPLHIAIGTSNLVYFTDGGWSPGVYTFDFSAGTNVSLWDDDNGVGGLAVTRDGQRMFTWRQYGWGAGDVNSWVTRFTLSGGVLAPRETSFVSWRRDPLDTPVLLNAAETLLFNKQQMFAATNLSVLIREFSENIYSISRRGDLAFGNSKVFGAATGLELTNLPFASTVQAVSATDESIFLYRSNPSEVTLQPLALLVGAGWETNQPPTPNFTRTPTNATTRTPVTFDASSSTDDQSKAGLEYRWDWENDGIIDTEFATNAIALHRYNIAGTKTAAVQVKDRYGALSTLSQTFNVAQEDDPGMPGGGNPVFEVQFAAADVEFDPVRPYAYVSGYANQTLVMLNLLTGLIERQFNFDWMPESITVSPNGQKMYVALLRRAHSAYWFGGHTNYIAEFDLASQSKTKEFEILADPYDLAVTDGGILVVPGGSDQWTDIRTYRASDGQLLSTSGIRQMSRLSLHPSQRAVYTADTDSSPSDIRRYDFDPVTGVFLSSWDSPYHGDYAMNGNVWCFPNGSNVLVRGAHVFTSSPAQANDMRFVRSLAGGVVEGATFDPAHDALLTVGGDGPFGGGTNQLRYYNLTTGELVWSQIVSNGTRYIHATSRDVYISWLSGNRTLFQRLSNPALPDAVITQNPRSQTVNAGGWVSFSVGVRGAPPFSYQWFFESAALAGQTNASLLLNNVQETDGGGYFVVVSNLYSSATSAVARLSVLVPPGITQQPSGVSVPAGGAANFAVQAGGTAPLRYQWSFEGVNIDGATNATLTLSNVQSDQAGAYRVNVSNEAGSLLSASAILRVTPAPPTLVSGPASVTVNAGGGATFSVTASGSAPFTYEWRFNGAPIPGANTPLLALDNAQAGDAGDYLVIVVNGVGSATSPVATLTVRPSAPVFTVQPQGATMPAGTNNLTLTSLARGSEPISYQWLFNEANLPGATATSLVLSNVGTAQSGIYAALASNAVGVTTSALATVTITGAPPVFVRQPADVNVDAGSTFTLTALASGSDPISYQWRLQGTNLPGGTSRTLTLTNAAPADDGPYTVRASNIFGVATSATANVSVIVRPTLLVTLTNLAVDTGAEVILSVVAQSSAPLNFTWRFNGMSLPASGSSLLLTNVQSAQAGTYRLTAANLDGAASSSMSLTVFRRGGSVVAWGDDLAGQSTVPGNLASAVSVAGGDFHSVALRRDGSVMVWGFGGDGLAPPPPTLSNVVAIAAGASHNLALDLNGRVISWGRNDYGQTVVPDSATSVVAVAAGEAHSVAVRQDGTVVAWGDNSLGQREVPVEFGFVTSVAAGRNHTVALRNDGAVIAWGLNSHGQCNVPFGLTGVTAVSAGYLHSLALRADGTIVAWGDNTYGQTSVPTGLSNIIAIAAGEVHSLALLADGHVAAWGDNAFHQLDIPSNLSGVSMAGAGYYHSLAVVPAVLRFNSSNAGLALSWNGSYMLQQSSGVLGPFEDVTATSPSTNLWSPGIPARFFRLRSLP